LDSPSHSTRVMPYFFARFSAVTTVSVISKHPGTSVAVGLTPHGCRLASRVLIHQCCRQRILQLQVDAVPRSKSGFCKLQAPSLQTEIHPHSLDMEKHIAHLVAPAKVYGLMLMASAPPVRQTSASPRAIVWAAVMALWNPEPHNL
jgi:hypothetical protein